MTYINPEVYQNGMAELSEGVRIDICAGEPTTRTQAVSTLSLADASVTLAAPAVNPGSEGGYRVTVPAVSDTINTTGTATHWALTDATRLLAVGRVSPNQNLVAGNIFNFPATDIIFPDPQP